MRALVVDDLLIARRLIVNNLKNMGFEEVVEAVDGVDALQLLKDESKPFDIIITDWLMPNIDGLVFVHEIRKFDKFKKVPVLMVTSVDDKEDVVKALKNGVNDYIAKPYTPDTLRKKVEKLLNISGDYLLK